MGSAQVIHIYKRRPRLAGKIAMIILLVILTAMAGAWLYWSTNKKQIIRNKIDKTIREKTAGLYKVNYEDMHVDELAGNLSIINMNVGVDSAQYAAIPGTAKKPGIILKLFIPLISISGIKTDKALAGKEIVGKKLHIKDPVIQLYYTSAGTDYRKIPNSEIYKQVLGDLDLIKIDTVELSNARIVTHNHTGKESVIFNNTNILLSEIAVDSLNNLDSNRFFFAKHMRFHTEKINWSASSGLYKYGISNMTLNSDNKELRIAGVDIDPQLGEAAFVNQLPYQSDRLNLHFTDIHFRNVDFDQLMNEVLVADWMETGSMTIKAYRDLRRPRDNKNRNGCYPHQVIMKAPIPFVIRKAVFRNSFVEYKEVNDISGQTGAVQLTNCTINASNLTNDPGTLRINNNCRIEVNGSLMDLTPMQATLIFPIGDKQGRFFIEGTTGGGEAVKLNKLTEPMGMARIKDGTVKSLHYKLSGNNTQANGTVTLLYDDLEIDFLELDDDKPSGIDKKDVTSFVASIFLKKSNPKNGNDVRTVNVQHARDMNRSFYNLVWKTIFEGINLTIGNKKKMKRP